MCKTPSHEKKQTNGIRENEYQSRGQSDLLTDELSVKNNSGPFEKVVIV